MAVSLKDLVPTKISRDLRGKFLLIYGAPEVLGTGVILL